MKTSEVIKLMLCHDIKNKNMLRNWMFINLFMKSDLNNVDTFKNYLFYRINEIKKWYNDKY